MPKVVTSATHFGNVDPFGAADVRGFVTSAALCAGSVSKQRGRTRALVASSRQVPQAAGITAARRRCALTEAFAPAIWAKASLSLAGKRLETCPRPYKPRVRAGEWAFAGTDHGFGVLRAARSQFPGTAADRLSWSAATARRCGGLCAMALLAAAVASRCSGYGHGHSGPSGTYAPSALTPNSLLGAFWLSTRQCFAAERPFPRPR